MQRSDVNKPDADSPQDWRGIHMSRGMKLRLSGLGISIDRDGKVHSPPPDLLISIDLFAYWLEIAMTHLIESQETHRHLLTVWGRGDKQEGGQWLEREFSSSLQCITAAAIAVDAFYAMVRDQVHIPEEVIQAWRNNRTSRPKCAFRGSRPPVPDDSGHRFRAKAAGYRSEATLVFLWISDYGF